MRQFQVAALPVDPLLLVLAHAVDLFIGVRDKAGPEPEISARQGFVVPCPQRQRIPVRDFLQQKFTAGVVKPKLQCVAPILQPHFYRDLAMAQGGTVFHDGNGDIVRIGGGRGKQGDAAVFQVIQQAGAYPQAIRAPGFNPDCFTVIAVEQGAALLFKIWYVRHYRFLLWRWGKSIWHHSSTHRPKKQPGQSDKILPADFGAVVKILFLSGERLAKRGCVL